MLRLSLSFSINPSETYQMLKSADSCLCSDSSLRYRFSSHPFDLHIADERIHCAFALMDIGITKVIHFGRLYSPL